MIYPFTFTYALVQMDVKGEVTSLTKTVFYAYSEVIRLLEVMEYSFTRDIKGMLCFKSNSNYMQFYGKNILDLGSRKKIMFTSSIKLGFFEDILLEQRIYVLG